ncbi:MAG: ATP-binding cassette domain-containing protein [bacterium]|nr:ATP-binding cassette domain-containing protein [bacterium]
MSTKVWADPFGIVRELTAQGTAVVFITHKLNEVLAMSQRITVLRRGRTVGTVATEGSTEESLARLMVGRNVLLHVERVAATPGEPLLQVEDLHVFDDRGIEKVAGVSFEVRAGEIVGIAGVDGNGQTELIDAIAGLRAPASGTISIDGHELVHHTAREALDLGIGHIPDDRQRRGLVLEFTLAENIALHDYASEPASKHGWLFPGRLVERADGLIQEFDVRGGDAQTKAGSLSGGNQQKLVAAREIARDPRILIAAQPTRGVDVGAIEYLHRRLIEERDQGRAILLVSLELDEVLSLSDRLLVMYEGRIVAEHGPGASESEVGLEMLGGQHGSAA